MIASSRRQSAGPDTQAWEAAYRRFESPHEETRKFKRRLRALGCAAWPRELMVVELFCGRGSGVRALQELGFEHVAGVDLSCRLVSELQGSAPAVTGDCRHLPLADSSCDVAIVQGGLHHLPVLSTDLARALDEVVRILRPDGRLVIVEPWLTPFLRMVHAVCGFRTARWAWPRLDALAEMIEHERFTYEAWLAAPQMILSEIEQRLEIETRRARLGKLAIVARKRRPV